MPTSLEHARVAFTGKLAYLSRQEAHQLVREGGGEVTLDVSRQTSLLVVGMEGWPLLADGMVSSKLKRAEEFIQKGFPIKIVSEEVFLELAGCREGHDSHRKTYPAT